MSLLKRKDLTRTFPAVFSDFFNSDKFFGPGWLDKEFEQTLPAVNIRENGKQYTVELAAPGFEKNDFKVQLAENMLTISAEKEGEKTTDDEHYARREYAYNAFTRSFTLPENCFGEQITANYENGILRLVIAKKAAAQPALKKDIPVS